MWRLLKNRRLWIAVIVVAGLVAVALWPATVPVETTTASRGSLRVTIDEEGRTRVRDRFVVAAPVTGRVLRIELEEFSHLFTSPAESTGLLRLRATLVDPTPAGETLLGQRVFIVQKPALTADAAGGTRALAAAARQVAVEIDEWVAQGVK